MKLCCVVATVKIAIRTFIKRSILKHITAHYLEKAKIEIVRQQQEDSFRTEVNVMH